MSYCGDGDGYDIPCSQLHADDEAPFPEPFGPLYVRPEGAPCPHCDCCTARLCATARDSGLTCVAHSDDPKRVRGCPCTATAVPAGGRPLDL